MVELNSLILASVLNKFGSGVDVSRWSVSRHSARSRMSQMLIENETSTRDTMTCSAVPRDCIILTVLPSSTILLAAYRVCIVT